MQPLRPAVLLDRDGTLIVEKHYLSDPAQVELLPGAAEAVARLNRAGFPVVVASNQAGVARGLFPLEAVQAVNRRVDELLAAAGARLDGTFFCPHHPDFGSPCTCRKPGPGLGRQAAARLGLDLAASWVVGDRRSDVEFGLGLGARAILVLTGYGAAERQAVEALGRGVTISRDLPDAVYFILEQGPGPAGGAR